MSRTTAIEAAQAYLDDGGFEADLADLVARPTESQVPEGRPHCEAYLSEAMVPRLEGLGFICRIIPNPVDGFGPILIAERKEGEGLPTVLGYGHGDVIRGQDGRWTKGKGPWALAREGDRLYGRGTADNKGQHLINLEAMRAVKDARGGRLGFNAKFMIETGEENGCPGLRQVIEENREAFMADVFIASDGPRVNPNRPTISLGCRGAQNFDLVCDLRPGAHHSGNWGGVIADPAVRLAHAIGTIVSETGEIQVPEWRPPAPSPLVRELVADITLAAGPDGPVPTDDWGEPSLTAAENLYAFNSFAVLAMHAGVPEAPVNAIAGVASAHCQLRYIVETDAGDILPALRRHLEARGFGDVEVRDPPPANAAGPGGFGPSRTEPNHPWALLVRRSLEATSGEAPAVIPQMGGSICNDLFTDLLGIPAIWVPHSYTGCSQHAPDEHVVLSTCRSGLALMAGLYYDIGDAAP